MSNRSSVIERNSCYCKKFFCIRLSIYLCTISFASMSVMPDLIFPVPSFGKSRLIFAISYLFLPCFAYSNNAISPIVEYRNNALQKRSMVCLPNDYVAAVFLITLNCLGIIFLVYNAALIDYRLLDYFPPDSFILQLTALFLYSSLCW